MAVAPLNFRALDDVAFAAERGKLANIPADYESRLIKMNFDWSASNRERILEEWNKRYNAKSEPKK